MVARRRVPPLLRRWALAGALLEKALAWPAGDVRAAALSLLIDRGDTDRAAQLGTDDADADVRRKIGRRLEDAAQTALF